MFPPRLISRNLILFFSVFILTCLLLVLFDSFYYGEVTLRKLWDLDLEWSDWKCAPLNFIMYNVVPGNLAQHGSHPFYLHTLVNIPLLFGPLGKVFFICHHLNIVFEIPFNIFFRHRNALVNPLVYHGHVSIFLERETRGPNCLCFNCLHLHRLTRTSIHLPTPGIVSLALSFNQSGYFNLAFYFFPQEARFIIPLILPCILLSSHKLRYKILGYRPFLTLWYIFNIGMVLFFGFIHQAGVYPTLR